MFINSHLFYKWRWMIFILLIMIALPPKVTRSKKSVKKKFCSIEKIGWEASNKWIRSVECFRKTGVCLAFCKRDVSFLNFTSQSSERKSELIDFTLEAPADDVGHTLLLTLKAKLQDRSMKPLDIAKINIYINVLGLILLLAITFSMRLYLVFLLLLLFSKKIFFTFHGLSPHPGFIGATALAFVLPLTIIGYNSQSLGNKETIIYGLAGLLGLSLAVLIRGAIGSMGFMVTSCVLLFVLWEKRKELKKAILPLVLGLCAFLAIGSTHWVFMIRDTLSPIKVSKFTNSKSFIDTGHGISHTLYVGLGLVPNPWGIKWSDKCGKNAVGQVNPQITYISPQYFKTIHALYINILKKYPGEVAKIYWQKFKRTMLQGEIMNKFIYTGAHIFSLLLFLILFTFYKKSAVFSLTFVCLLFLIFFVLQGILAAPFYAYMQSSMFIFCMILGVVCDGSIAYLRERFVMDLRIVIKSRKKQICI